MSSPSFSCVLSVLLQQHHAALPCTRRSSDRQHRRCDCRQTVFSYLPAAFLTASREIKARAAASFAEAALRILPSRERSAVLSAMKNFMRSFFLLYSVSTEEQIIQESLQEVQEQRSRSKMRSLNARRSLNRLLRLRSLKRLRSFVTR